MCFVPERRADLLDVGMAALVECRVDCPVWPTLACELAEPRSV